jgi:hypothetical protein
VSELLAAAFHALGAGEEGLSWQETALVADALRKSGEPEVEALPCPSDEAAWERLKAFAEESGADALIALDLRGVYSHPAAYAHPMGPVRHYPADDD